MALRKPLVIVNGVIQQLQSGDQIDAPIGQTDVRSMVNGESSAAMPFGTPSYVSASGTVRRAKADASGTAKAVGLVADAAGIAAAASGNIAVSGVLNGATSLWDAVTGQTGGLTAGVTYYVDAATVGKITATAPATTGQFVMPVGTALSTTDMEVQMTPLGPVAL